MMRGLLMVLAGFAFGGIGCVHVSHKNDHEAEHGRDAHAHRHDPNVHINIETEGKPYSSLELNNDPAIFRFAIVTDNAGGPREGIFRDAMEKINSLQPEFVMSVGDFVEGYENSVDELNRQWDHFLKYIDVLELPFFFVPGNHDNGKPLWAEVYNKRFGVPYYHFLYKDVLFLCLNTNDGPEMGTGVSEEQIAYAKRTLEEYPDVRWTLVFQHKPLWNSDDAGYKQIQALLAGRKATVFAGHTHNYLAQQMDGISFFTLATTGGGTNLRGPDYGEFDHIAWVTMTESGPRVANLLLDGILDKDVLTPEKAKALLLFRQERGVTVTPIELDRASFRTGASTLRVVNPSADPLRFKTLIETQAGVRAEPSTVSVIVPGNSEHTAQLHISADKPVPGGQIAPPVLHWEASYDNLENRAPVKLGGEVRMLIESQRKITLLKKAPAIDGALSDWAELPYVVNQPGEIFRNKKAWKGVHDGAFRFGVARDDDFLYVAVEAMDDDVAFDGWKYWEDFAMVWVDPRSASEGAIEESAFNLIAGPEVTATQAAEFQDGPTPADVQKGSQKTANGFTAEFAIPLAAIKAKQGEDWKEVRLNIGFSDHDPRSARDGVSILFWRPQWRGPAASAVTGVFLR